MRQNGGMPTVETPNTADLGAELARPSSSASSSASSPARILSLVHRHGSLSRAQLTRLTGLNRSTVGVLIATLVSQGLVYEAAPTGEAQVGRPSPQVHPNPAVVALAIHPEIDAVTIGLVGLGGEVFKKIRYPTQRIPSAEEAVNIAAAVIAGMRGELDTQYRVVGVGVAVPGLVTTADGVVRHAPHLDWNNEPLADMLAAATGYRVRAANDASLAAEAEMTFGAATGIANLIYLNGGASGIGGGIVADGRLLTGVSGYAGEIGHTLVRTDGIGCHCGAFGCLETEVRQAPLLAALKLDAGDPVALTLALSLTQDPAVTAEVHRQLAYLATALRNVVNVFNPEAVVLDGFLAALYAAAPENLLAAVAAQSMREPGAQVTIHPAALGADLMMLGAAELAFAELLADPTGFMEAH